MEFPVDYFEDEVRDGFYIPAIMKRNFASQIEVLNDIDIVCKKYGLTYFAEWGTMLGAIRHGGFIPWDDDLDIAMPRKDYKIFCEVVEKELGGYYYLMNWSTHDEFSDGLSHLYNAKAITFDPAFLQKFHGFPYMSGVDIFPIDYLPRDKDALKDIMDRAQEIHDLALVINGTVGDEKNRILDKVEELYGSPIERNKLNLRFYLMGLVDELFGSFDESECDLMGHFAFYAKHGTQGYPKEWFDKLIRVPFENTTIPIIACYDSCLKNKYGNYLKSVKHTSAHDYPSYSVQEQMLKDETGKELPTFHIAKSMWESPVKKAPAVKREHKEVVFYTYRPDAWNGFDRAYREVMDDPDTVVYVIPVTYYHKDISGNVIDKNCHMDGFPEHVLVYGVDDYDVEAHHPDKIYIQVPFDQWNYSITTHPIYYAEYLSKHTEELIYIPFFEIDELTDEDECGCYWVKSHAILPAIVYADKVVLQSENMKKYYLDALCAEAGWKTRKIWNKKITWQDALFEKEQEAAQKELPLGKKQVLVNFEFGTFFENPDTIIRKISNTIDVFKNNPEVIMRWWVPPYLIDNLKNVMPDTAAEFDEILTEAMNSDFILVDNTGDAQMALQDSDAYYGDACRLAKQMERQGKPLMLEDVNI